MDAPQGTNPAFGSPSDPKWTRSDKDGIGAAATAGRSNIWFSIAKGVVTEVYYPTIDLPQIRDLQYLATDGATFFHDERRGFDNNHETLSPESLGYRITNNSHPIPSGQTYQIIKRVISAPREPCLLIHTKLVAPQPLRSNLKLYALLAPHMDGSGYNNSGWILDSPFGKILVAQSQQTRGTWLALGATVPFLKCSCGIVGVTDGWQDLNGSSVPGNRPFVMDWSFDCALNSNIALTGQLDISGGDEFVLGLAFGETINSAVERLRQALSLPFDPDPSAPGAYNHLQTFLDDWTSAHKGIITPGPRVTGDGDKLYRMCRSILTAHEDKTYSGALIASLTIPWGEWADDVDFGYHLVWTRDMCNSATGLLASGDKLTPLRALIFLATAQRGDGAFYQNFRVDGSPYRTNIQMDEIAFPIMFAWRLDSCGALQGFDPYPMVKRAAVALILNGPMTQQERWEENEGYSPSTLAACISALVCAASMAKKKLGEGPLADFLLEYADFLESNLEKWTVADDCQFLPNVRHYCRILPTWVKGDSRRVGPENVPALAAPDGDPNQDYVYVGNRNGLKLAVKNLLDPGFLELVRYGIRDANDPLISHLLRCVDAPGAAVKVDFTVPSRSGPGWHRYNEDGYGNYADGRPFDGSGRGGIWPLLTGERGHHALAAGKDPTPYIHAMENFAEEPGLISEQLWDLPDHPTAHMRQSYPSGAAMPLCWAHAEYVKLVRSATDKAVFDLIPEVAKRYLSKHNPSTLEIWNFYRQIDAISQSSDLRIILAWPFRLHWTSNSWANSVDKNAESPAPGLFFVDLPALNRSGAFIFTFFWTETQRWQQINYQVNVR